MNDFISLSGLIIVKKYLAYKFKLFTKSDEWFTKII